ncbi:Heterokaryon incompatibility protein (HET) domain containing protein [Hyaloscypha variabilis]
MGNKSSKSSKLLGGVKERSAKGSELCDACQKITLENPGCFGARPTELCDACQKITLENLGCFEARPRSFATDGIGNFDDWTGYEYPHSLGDLDELKERCGLCALVWHIIYGNGQAFKRDKTSRIKLAYCDMPNFINYRNDDSSRACFRVRLSKQFNNHSALGSATPLFLHVFTKPEDEQRLAYLAFGRQVVPADSEVAFQRVLSNLNDCIKNHPACARTFDGSICDESTVLPSRLIDLGTRNEDIPLLVETAGSNSKYVALSYCWGKDSTSLKFQTTTSTISSFKKRLPLEHIPKTIKDAVAITKRLGFRYLWVDRLCIIQDNKADWQTEVQKMRYIYEGAVCTIAAVGAKDSGEGCFLPRQREISVPLPLQTCTLFVSLPPAGLKFETLETMQSTLEMEDSVWSTRAWVFQERLFSRRMILYGRSQIFWECRMHLDSERRFGHDAGYSYKSSCYQYCHDFKKLVNIQISKTVQESSSSSSTLNPISSPYNWNEIVAQYSQMELTCESDRLPAIDSLAQAVQQQTKLEVCAGTWLGNLPQTLFWWPFWWDEYEIEVARKYKWQDSPPKGARNPRLVRSSKFEAPTWSWLAAGTPVSFYPFFRATVLSIERPKFLLDSTTPNHSSQSAAKLEIWAHTITADRTGEQCGPTVFKNRTEQWHKVPSTNFNGIWDRWEAEGIYGLIDHEHSERYNGLVLFDDPESAPGSFDCAILGAGPGILDDSDVLTIYFLIIQPTATPPQYRRLGIGFRVLARDSDYLQRIPPKQRIVLI